jgi:hypothetical protein
MRVTVTNSGARNSRCCTIATRGDFTQTNGCGSKLAPGKNCNVDVQFVPAASGTRFGNLTVRSDDPASPQIVVLTGTGTAVQVSPTSLVFDPERVGKTSPPQDVQVTNMNSVSLPIASITASGDFAQTNDCPNPLPANANCKISVTFTPTQTGTRTGSVSIVDTDSTSPQQ